ncbi:hypothetical protein OOU_Y34scaffold00516g82 [Pyricularia oryzae Y34]|uniref:Uncharacterized protein n=2 Tax=Pyricularia oryzae TaxID=318829 RepID=A0AA97PLH5_PYRO3|nr:hypothetical protein OOU_Y34scaffold00516g82 [Pyricularia oryzae Y34]
MKARWAGSQGVCYDAGSKSSGSSLPGTGWRQGRASATRGRDLFLLVWGRGGTTTRVLLGGVLCRNRGGEIGCRRGSCSIKWGANEVIQQRTPGCMCASRLGEFDWDFRTTSAARSRRAHKTRDLTVGKPNWVRTQVIDLTGATQTSTEYGP